jgi:NAD(P)-dependent dehydrogenase (short-subunit alcohol dehydrogenase family)
MKNLEGKIAVITGGSSGIGLATAQRLVEEVRMFLSTISAKANLMRLSSGSAKTSPEFRETFQILSISIGCTTR